ncbi:related to rhamnosidase B [Cephalotrichum gorgonifer]|uniref:Related to rhamnosidase B n=1 Tax=Cephalotrichum gorgonifer TaxID=2041049 RepID=A0AAE8N305_9PEZI|nr:related to rhamnosidase B [Cephalotrichum gorgonifer]
METAGLFVHFRKSLNFDGGPPDSLPIRITADTRYKLYVNRRLISFGPVKGDRHLWFYDEVDIAPFLQPGENTIAILVLRYFYGTSYAPSFPRLPVGGLRVVTAEPESQWADLVQSGASWETAIDPSRILRVDEIEDDFLHVYERVSRGDTRQTMCWVPAQPTEVRISTGNSTHWRLSPRLIPPMRGERVQFRGVRKVQSSLSADEWRATLAPQGVAAKSLRLPPNSTHRLDLEAPAHVTAFIRVHFKRPYSSGARLTLTYSESYENEPRMTPYLRTKGHRLDDRRSLYGPKDIYDLEGPRAADPPEYHENEAMEEVIAPFHWRTFRFIQLHIEVSSSEVVLLGFNAETANYPMDVKACVKVAGDDMPERLWNTSVRTLQNCMHDCYEDCPFYEQLQYIMDTRSSILFTYYASGDDRLARQAITQIHNSFQPMTGLTCSRAPSHRPQVIPHFSLYWILMLADHLSFFNDAKFIKKFLPVADAVLGYFDSHIDPGLGLVVSESGPGIWNFVDWAEQWRPYGIPPTAERTGIATYTNQLYAYTLKTAASMISALGKPSLAEEYLQRANGIIQAVRDHCFDGDFFTDSLASQANGAMDYSQHSQVWAVISGAVTPEKGQELLRQCLRTDSKFVTASVSMAFYTLRALSAAGGTVYDELFHRFWDPWRNQLALGVTTWEEDSVSQRSDCHAWGSAPIYEFMAEVAGVSPLKAGWTIVSFRPRLTLYTEFSATVPMGMANGSVIGMARVSWTTDTSTKTIAVSLRFAMETHAVIPVHVALPGEPTHLLKSSDDLIFFIKS